MGATFSRLKNWVAEILSYADLNAEIDNILNNLDPSGAGDYSANAAQMQTVTDPGEVGTESLATSLAGELERLRFAIKEIKGSGAAQWYSTVGTSLTELINVLGNSLSDNRIASGKASANSSRLIALDPSGAAPSVTLDGTPTPFIYYIGGTQYTISTDVTASGLSAAPSTNNTCLVNDATFSDDQFTQFLGEYGTGIPVDNMGSEISSLVGRYAGFKVNNGAADEYFIAYVESSIRLTRAQRGCFVNSSQTAVPRIAFSNNDTITLLRMAWVFATSAGGLAVTYNIPTYAATQPSSPTTGDYWFDTANNAWMYYNSSAWVSADATLIGLVLSDSTNCVAAMTLDAASNIDSLNTLQVTRTSNSVVSLRNAFGQINVAGSIVKYGRAPITWDMASHLEAGVTEAANTFYYLYVKESGAPLISSKVPTDRRGDLAGLYHPEELWRCIAVIKNDGSSNLDADTLYEFSPDFDDREYRFNASTHPNNFTLTTSVAGNDLTVKLLDRIGNYPSELIPVTIPFRDATVTNGNQVLLSVREILSITAANGASLGHTSSKEEYIWVHLINDDGTPRLALAGRVPYEQVISSSTTISGSATSGSVLYASTGSTNMPVRLIGRLQSNQSTAGTYTTAISLVTCWPVVQRAYTEPVAYTPGTGGFGTISGVNVWSRREGKMLHVQGTFTTGTCTGDAARVAIGYNGTSANITLDAAIMGSVVHTIGSYATNGNAQSGHILYDGSTTGEVSFSTAYAVSASQVSPLVGTSVAPNSGTVTFHFSLPIAGWSEYGPV